MENFVCEICGGEKYKEYEVKERMLNRGDIFKYTKCEYCGTIHLMDGQVNGIKEYYEGNYYAWRESSRKCNILMFLKRIVVDLMMRVPFSEGMAQFMASRIAGYVVCLNGLNLRKRSKILDVGCGSGDWLYFLQMCGFKNLLGIDAFCDKFVSESICKKMDIFDNELDICGKFDLITFHHSFEHMNNPHNVLRRAKELLTDTGKIIIRIPVGGSEAWRRFGTDWYQLDAPRHLYIYTEKSMYRLCRKNGLNVTRVLYDSLPSQFFISKMYSETDLSFSEISDMATLAKWKKYKMITIRSNKNHKGDMAVFYISRIGS